MASTEKPNTNEKCVSVKKTRSTTSISKEI